MSTRCNVILKEGNQKLFFYRHSDGYPECTAVSLNVFMKWLKEGKIRNDVGQGSGWLIMLGAMEYNTIPKYKVTIEKVTDYYTREDVDLDSIESPKDWKVGAYEPTTGIHGDIEYLYIIDLDTKTLKCYSDWTDHGNGIKEVNIKKYLTETAIKS